jgi:hypothetical protein
VAFWPHWVNSKSLAGKSSRRGWQIKMLLNGFANEREVPSLLLLLFFGPSGKKKIDSDLTVSHNICTGRRARVIRGGDR